MLDIFILHLFPGYDESWLSVLKKEILFVFFYNVNNFVIIVLLYTKLALSGKIRYLLGKIIAHE